MGQFDLYANPRGGVHPLLLDVQADLLAQLDTRVVVPLAKRDRYPAMPMARLGPIANIDAVEYVLVFPLLAAVPRSALGERVGSLASRRPELIAALDLLFTGS